MANPKIPYLAAQVKISSGAGWEVRPDDARLLVAGHCPACGAVFEDEIIQRAPGTATAASAAVTRQTRTFHCSCFDPHPDRPDGVLIGCGRSWSLTFVHTGDAYSVEPGDRAMEAASNELAEVVRNQVQSVRNAAEKWIAGVTALLGLLGVAGVAVGKDAISGLRDGSKISAGILIGLAIIAAAVAVWAGYSAAYGWPKEREVKTDEQLEAWYRSRRTDVAKSIRKSVIFAVGALLLLTAGVGVIWFGSPADSYVQISYTDSDKKPATACGTLTDSNGKFLALKAGDDQSSSTTSYPVGSITSVKTVSKC